MHLPKMLIPHSLKKICHVFFFSWRVPKLNLQRQSWIYKTTLMNKLRLNIFNWAKFIKCNSNFFGNTIKGKHIYVSDKRLALLESWNNHTVLDRKQLLLHSEKNSGSYLWCVSSVADMCNEIRIGKLSLNSGMVWGLHFHTIPSEIPLLLHFISQLCVQMKCRVALSRDKSLVWESALPEGIEFEKQS